MNILIVESHNDGYFVQALINKLNQPETTTYSIDEFKYSSVSEKSLRIQIESALTTRGLAKIGVILDLDEESIDSRIALINSAYIAAYQNIYNESPPNLLSKVSTFIDVPIDEYITIKLSCYFTNVDGSGELETVLQKIKNKESVFADCLLKCWQPCIEKNGKKIAKKGETGDISDKEILKLWVDFYKRFDTLKKKDRGEKTTDWKGIWLGELSKPNDEGVFEKINDRGKDIFNLDSPILDEFKKYLHLFD